MRTGDGPLLTICLRDLRTRPNSPSPMYRSGKLRIEPPFPQVRERAAL